MTIGAGGSLRKVRLGNVEAAHKNRIVAIGKTTSSLNSEIMAQLRVPKRLRRLCDPYG
jgi:hypothetical protein